MKFLFVALLLLLPTLHFAQPLSYYEVIDMGATPSTELKKRAEAWLYSNTDYTEKKGNTLVGKSSIVYNPTIFYGSSGTKGVITYRVVISVRDSGYSYNIIDFTHIGNDNNVVNLSFGKLTEDKDCPRHMKGQRKGWENKVWRELKGVSSKQAFETSKSIKAAMTKQSLL